MSPAEYRLKHIRSSFSVEKTKSSILDWRKWTITSRIFYRQLLFRDRCTMNINHKNDNDETNTSVNESTDFKIAIKTWKQGNADKHRGTIAETRYCFKKNPTRAVCSWFFSGSFHGKFEQPWLNATLKSLEDGKKFGFEKKCNSSSP